MGWTQQRLAANPAAVLFNTEMHHVQPRRSHSNDIQRLRASDG